MTRARVRSSGCPFCSGKRPSVTNSLAALNPQVAAEWHPIKNGTQTPEQVTVGTNRRVWWRCTRNRQHEWASIVYTRTQQGYGCPYCAGRLVLPGQSLAARFPTLAAQWHPTKNGGLRPEATAVGSSKQVWWRCPMGPDHEWRAPVSARTAPCRLGRGPGRCPFCSNKLVSITNCLATRRPKLARQWHPTKNRKLTPRDVVYKSSRKIWWTCPAGSDHVWRVRVLDRSREDTGCPFCCGQRVSTTNSLASLRPDLAAEWHPTKNRRVTPARVNAGSERKVWWRCSRDRRHEWSASVASRSRLGSGCPFCSHHRVLREDSLAVRCPRIAAQWHRQKNGRLRPDQVPPSSNRMVWWRCPKGPDHVWTGKIGNRVRSSGRCPYCADLRVAASNSLAGRYPQIAREWHPQRNGPTRPAHVLATSWKRCWWQCPQGHSWRAMVRERTAEGRHCPACAESLGPPRGRDRR